MALIGRMASTSSSPTGLVGRMATSTQSSAGLVGRMAPKQPSGPESFMIEQPRKTTTSTPFKLNQPFASTPLGVGVNTALGLPKAVWDSSKFVADALTELPGQVARSVVSLGGDVYNAAVPEAKRKYEVPAGPFSVLPGFGKEPIKSKAE